RLPCHRAGVIHSPAAPRSSAARGSDPGRSGRRDWSESRFSPVNCEERAKYTIPAARHTARDTSENYCARQCCVEILLKMLIYFSKLRSCVGFRLALPSLATFSEASLSRGSADDPV